jgi:TolB-like protein
VHEDIRDRLDARFADGGERTLKNIARAVRVWSWSPGASGITARAAPLAPPERPSIAVLPFTNMSGDAEQEYFADGMVEDVITALSRFKSLFVIARNSSFTYKGKAVDIRQVGRELGVRYVLEGSVRKAASRVRITGQLIDSETGGHLWADRFDGGIEDVFALQDRITEQVVIALVPHVERAEIERSRRKPAGNLDAYDLCLRGLSLMRPITQSTIEEALQLFRRAIELDPGFSMPYGLMMCCIANRRTFGLVDGADTDRAELERLSRIATRIGAEDAVTMAHAGWATAYVLHDLALARQFVERALALNPNLAAAWQYSGWINLWQGNPGVAAEQLAHAIRQDPQRSMETTSTRAALAHAYFFLDRYDEVIDLAEAQVRDNPLGHAAMRAGLASAGLGGRADMAQSMRERLLRIDPAFRVSRLSFYLGPYPPALRAKYAEGLRRAGVPE